ncbi:MAG: hypothetical protein H6702_04155 [Myxococcales bacterium]|nr:hypothetical protein [Myxococcales bacterium]
MADLNPTLHPLARALARLWPHASGLALSVFFALAERQTWQPGLDRPLAPDLVTFFATRIPAPVEYLAVAPVGGGVVLLVLALLILAHILKPVWYLAPLGIMGVLAWHVWGTIALGRMG